MEPNGNKLIFSEDEQRLAHLPEAILRSEAAQTLTDISSLAKSATDRFQELQMSPMRSDIAKSLAVQASLRGYGSLLLQLQRVVDPHATDGVEEIVELWAKKTGN